MRYLRDLNPISFPPTSLGPFGKRRDQVVQEVHLGSQRGRATSGDSHSSGRLNLRRECPGMSGDRGDSGRSWECSAESALVPSVVARTHCSLEASPRPWGKEAPTRREQGGEGGFSLQAVKGAAHPLGLTPGSLSFPKGHRRAGQVRCPGCSLRAQGGVEGLGRPRRMWDQKENIIVRNYGH